jgi:hypothetical protein
MIKLFKLIKYQNNKIGLDHCVINQQLKNRNHQIIRELDVLLYYFKYKDISKCVRKYRIKTEIYYNKEQKMIQNAIIEIKKIYPILNSNLFIVNSNNKSLLVIKIRCKSAFFIML